VRFLRFFKALSYIHIGAEDIEVPILCNPRDNPPRRLTFSLGAALATFGSLGCVFHCKKKYGKMGLMSTGFSGVLHGRFSFSCGENQLPFRFGKRKGGKTKAKERRREGTQKHTHTQTQGQQLR